MGLSGYADEKLVNVSEQMSEWTFCCNSPDTVPSYELRQIEICVLEKLRENSVMKNG